MLSTTQKSPRPRSKQAHAVATPVSKRATEYAGPSFNHSPAPSSLPPPPFLFTASVRRSGAISASGSAASSSDGSPHSAAPGGNNTEQILSSRPVHGVINAASTQLPHNTKPTGLFNLEGEDAALPPKVQKSVTASKNPWAAVEKPIPINLLEPHSASATNLSIERPVQAKREMTEHNPVRRAKQQEPRTNSSKSTTTDAKTQRNPRTPGRKLDASLTRKKHVQEKAQSSQNSTPRTILKRQVPVEAVTTAVIPEAKLPPARQLDSTASSSSPPLQPLSEKPRSIDIGLGSYGSEQDLRLQAANLMSILHVPTTHAAHENRPRQYPGAPPSTDETISIEENLRRILHLGVKKKEVPFWEHA